MAWDYYEVGDGGWQNGNFRSGVKPVDGDDVMIPTSLSCGIAGTDQSGIKLGELWIDAGYRFGIGSAASPLIIDAACITHNGDGPCYFESDDNGSGEYTDRIIVNSPNEQLAAHIDGERVDKIYVVRGTVTLASTLGTVQRPLTVIVGGNQGAIGSAQVTMNGEMDGTGTFILFNGRAWSNAQQSIVYVCGGEYRHNQGALGALYCSGGVAYINADSSLGSKCTAAYLLPGAIIDAASEAEYENKFDDVYSWPGSRFIYDPKRTTITNGIRKIAGGGQIVTATR